MIVIVDYGVGNLFSLKSSLKAIGADVKVSGDADVIRSADKIFLPGVGAFRDAKAKLEASGLDSVIKEQAAKGVYIMGICLGMQMLFEKSLEYGEYDGLGLIKGTVEPIHGVIPDGLKIPHIGWNGLKFCGEKHPVFKYINEGDCVYFVHSYYGENCEKNVIAQAEYGAMLTAAVADKNVIGCQFHPEKSGEVGLNILRAFCELGG